MLQSLESQDNVLFSNQRTVSSLSNDLDMKKLLKYGDTYITSPLLQEIQERTQASENFIIKRNFLSLFCDFIKWADIQGIIQLCYTDYIKNIAGRIAEVDGKRGLAQGENIYPEIKGQKEAKKKFYIQFLKSLQIWSKTITEDMVDPEQLAKINQFYVFFKIQQNFVFPENLMLNRIIKDFQHYRKYNEQRNNYILQRLKNDESSIMNSNKSKSLHRKNRINSNSFKKSSDKKTFNNIKEQLEKNFEDFATLCDDRATIHEKMKNLLHFKANFDNDFQNVVDYPSEEELYEVLDTGDALIASVNEIVPFYHEYRDKKISFQKFEQLYIKKIQELEASQRESEGMKTRSINPSNNEYNLQSSKGQENIVLNSINFQPQQKPNEIKHQKTLNNMKQLNNSKENSQILDKNEKKFMTSYGQSNNLKSSQNDYSQSIFGKQIEVGSGDLQMKDKMSRLENKSLESSGRNYAKNSHDSGYMSPQYQGGSSSSSEHQKKAQKILENSFQSIGDKISERRLSRGQASLASIKSNKMNDSMASMRNKLNQSIQSHKKSLKNSRDLQKDNQSQIQNYVDYSKQQYQLVKNNINDLSHSKHSFKKSIHSGSDHHQFSRHISSNKGSPISGSYHQQVAENRVQKLENFNRNSQISESIKNQSSVKSSKSRSKIFSKGKNSIEQNQHNLSSLINKDRRVQESYHTNSDKFQGSNLSKNQQDRNSGLASGIKSPSRKASGIKLVHDQYISPEDFKSKISKRSIKPGHATPKSSHLSKNMHMNNPDQNLSSVYYAESPMRSYQAYNDYRDQIKQPDRRQLNQSYHGMNEISSMIKQKKCPSFKQCFQVHNVVITENDNRQRIFCNNIENGNLFRRMKSQQSNKFLRNQPQEEYLMMKLKRAYDKEKNKQIQFMQEGIMRIKNSNSRLKNSMDSNKSRGSSRTPSNEHRSSNSNSSLKTFNSAKSQSDSSRSISPISRGGQHNLNRSKVSGTSLEGRLINMNIYERYFLDYKEEKTKKSLIRTKTLMVKNQDLQIGCLYHKGYKDLKLSIYVTPQKDLYNVSWNIPKQQNLNFRSHPKGFDNIPQKKQVKITVMVSAKAFPFNLPKFQLNYDVANLHSPKQIQFYLPCPIHRFIEFSPPSSTRQFQKKFQTQLNKLRTDQFKINRKVAKLRQFPEYFPEMTVIKEQNGMKKYGSICSYGQNKFSLMITTFESNKACIQAISHGSSEFVEYFVSSLEHILRKDD